MGVPKTKWTAEEETALIEGVRKYGTGKWRMIQKDDELGPVLLQRSNVDLKDKWRNMHPSADGEPSPSKLSPSVKRAFTSGSLGFGRDSASKSHSGGEDSARKRRTRPVQDSAIVDAIRALKPGATAESVASFIEQQKRQDAPPPDFRKQLAAQLRLLTDTGKIEKVKNLFFVAGEMPKKTPPVIGIFDGVKGTLNVEFIGYRQDDGERVAQFRINGRVLTASEISAEVSKAVSEAERAADAAIAAAQEYNVAEQTAAELERAAGMHPGAQWTRAGKALRAS